MFFAVCLCAFVGILITMRMLKLASLVINKGVEATQIATVLLAIIPTFLEIALPLSALLGTMLAFARLSGDSELIVLKASGVSFRNLIIPVIMFGTLVSFGSLVTSAQLKPWGYSTLAETFFEIARVRTTAGITQGIFNKLGVLTLYSEKIVDSTGELMRVIMDDQRNPEARKIITAEKGWIRPDPANQLIVFILNNGQIHEVIDGKYVVTDFDANRILINPDQLTSPDTSQKGAAARELYNHEIASSIKEFEVLLEQAQHGERIFEAELTPLLKRQLTGQELSPKNIGKKLSRLLVEKQLRVALPCASLLLALVALPLGVHPPRAQKTWGAGLSVMLGMFVFVVYYAVLSLGLALAESGQISPFVATWLPNLLIAMVATFFIERLWTEKWHSVTGGIQTLFADMSLLWSRFIRKQKDSSTA